MSVIVADSPTDFDPTDPVDAWHSMPSRKWGLTWHQPFAAGHGKTLDGRYYFLPHDLRYHTDQSLVRDAIGQDRLQAWFARIMARKAVLMFDTCEAGSLTERGKTRGGRIPAVPPVWSSSFSLSFSRSADFQIGLF